MLEVEPRSLDQPASQREHGGLRAVAGGEFLEDVSNVPLHRAEADEELACDVGVAVTARDQPEDLGLTRREW